MSCFAITYDLSSSSGGKPLFTRRVMHKYLSLLHPVITLPVDLGGQPVLSDQLGASRCL